MVLNGIIILWLFQLIPAETFGTNGVHWSNTFIDSGVNQLIVGASAPSNSVLRCSILCSESSQHESFYYSSSLQVCYCNTQFDGTANSTIVDTGLIYGKREIVKQALDCLDLYQRGYTTNGVYVIYPANGVTVQAWCDMTGGGWTVIQRRQDGSETFYRPWNDYVTGFGNRTGEYWLGLETMSIMTNESSTLRIELETFGDVSPVSAFAEYSSFAIGSSASKYQLTVSGFSGDCGDSMAYHNGMPFTTYDNSNDNAYYYDFYTYYYNGQLYYYYYNENCAYWYYGGWWYNDCHKSNLNGLYLGGANTANSEGINWYYCWGFNYSLKTSVMKIRRNI